MFFSCEEQVGFHGGLERTEGKVGALGIYKSVYRQRAAHSRKRLFIMKNRFHYMGVPVANPSRAL